MKFITIIACLLICCIPAYATPNFLKEYITDRYPIRIVDQMPEGTGHCILMISTRNIKQGEDLVVKRGLDPRYRLSLFITALKNDTAFVIPLKDLDGITDYLSAEKNFLVLVDGHGKTFGHSMERGFELTERFHINMIVFDWPTDYLALRKTVYNATEVTVSFVRAMRILEDIRNKYYTSSAVSVLFHSMGNRIIKDISSTKLLGKMPEYLFNNIIINAAAVRQRNHARWVENLNIQKRIYITMNDRDFNLRGAALIRIAEQLGLSNHNKTAKNAFYVNFSDLSTEDHNLFLGKSQLEKTNPEVFIFYDLAFQGKEVTIGENTGFQILSPSDKSFLFSEK
jgi:hypothetical protein